MVIDYKVHYQYLTLSKIYFYECSGNLCVTEVKDNSMLLYSTYDCGYNDCPIYKKNIGDDYALLEGEQSNILYNYREGKIISKDYDDYEFINNDYIIVKKNNLVGVINKDNKVSVPIIYEELGYRSEEYLIGYNINSILAKKDNKYGIISFKDGSIIEDIIKPEEEIESLLKILKES